MDAPASSGSSEADAIPSLTTDFNAYHARLLQAVMEPTKIARTLPGGEDMSFHRSLDRKFGKAVDSCSQRILSLANQLLNLTSGGNVNGDSRSKGKGKLRTSEDVVDRFQNLVVDATDELLEKADTCLDEFHGRNKAVIEVKPLPPKSRKLGGFVAGRLPASGRLPKHILNAEGLAKPQLQFKTPVDNSPTSIWAPTLKAKPNARVSLSWRPDQDMNDEDENPETSHPYYFENVHIEYPTTMFQASPPRRPRSFEDTPFTWVSTQAELDVMLSKLRGSPEIAVDLEHHDFRSYYGIVCLMQISNRDEDWVVDTLALREELEVLNEVFTDPNVVKVFHGAQSDIIWLQRDFNLYIVNLFDTYHASKTLQFPSFSLAFLLSLYCDFTADKRFQTADWRIRPLPEEMLAYARSDTHFLLFVYDNLRNALLERGQGRDELMRSVLELSKQVALSVHARDPYDEQGWGPGGWQRFAKKWNKNYFGSQLEVYKAIHAWRDRKARAEDESTRYVMPDHQMFALAERLPGDRAALMMALQGATSVAQSCADELLELIRVTVAQAEQIASQKVEEEKRRADAAQMQARDPLEGASNLPRLSNNRFAIFETAEDPESPSPSVDLWSRAQDPSTECTSSLFGNSLETTVHTPAVAATSSVSVLFGDSMPLADQRDDRYNEVVARVHASLAISATEDNPVDPMPVGAPEPGETQNASTTTALDAAAATAEVAFVPKEARQVQEQNVDDSIVVIGQARNKKRKRAVNLNYATMPATSSPGDDSLAGDVFPVPDNAAFDYSSVPDLLDGESQQNGRGKKQKKEKQKKGTNVQFGDFKAPPRPRNDPKSGNRSYTFKG